MFRIRVFIREQSRVDWGGFVYRLFTLEKIFGQSIQDNGGMADVYHLYRCGVVRFLLCEGVVSELASLYFPTEQPV